MEASPLEAAFAPLDAALAKIGVTDRGLYLEYYGSEARAALLKQLEDLRAAIAPYDDLSDPKVIPFPEALKIARIRDEIKNCMLWVEDEHDLGMGGSTMDNLEALEPGLVDRNKPIVRVAIGVAQRELKEQWGVQKLHDYWTYQSSFLRGSYLEALMFARNNKDPAHAPEYESHVTNWAEQLINSIAFPAQGTREFKLAVLEKMEPRGA